MWLHMTGDDVSGDDVSGGDKSVSRYLIAMAGMIITVMT